jgi:hypothetical protein
LEGVTLARRITTRLPFGLLHAVALSVAGIATAVFLAPRRFLRRWPFGDQLTKNLPLVQYTDVPFGMLVAEQFDRFGAPLEGRYSRLEIENWVRTAGLQIRSILPGLGWRAIAKRPLGNAGIECPSGNP